MKKEEKSRSFRGPLIELVIIIGVFAIVSVYILQMFMTADRLQRTAVNISKGTVLAESCAETMKGCRAETEAELVRELSQSFGLQRNEAFDRDGKLAYTVEYNKKWEPVEGEADIMMLVLFSAQESAGGLAIEGTVTILDSGEEKQPEEILTGLQYCSLQVKSYHRKK